MAVDPESLAVVYYPAPVLRQKAEPIEAVDDEVRAVAARMIELMYEHEGIGLAAPQVGLAWRMFVIRESEEDGLPDMVFINPKLSGLRGEMKPFEEGCLSLPGITAQVRRPVSVKIEATGLDGEPISLESDQFIARVWQHEFDHIDGVLILDRMSKLDRIALRKQIKALESRG